MEHTLIPILRTVVSFMILILVTLAIGKHINSHKNHYSFALSVTIGSFIANMGFDTNLKFKEMLISFLVLILMFYLFMVLSSRSRSFRKWLSGRPTVLIEKGKLLDKNMKKVKFSIDDLNQHLREKEIFNIAEVEYAMLEVNGELSILKKVPFQNAIKKDFNLPISSESLPVELVMDGQIIEKNASGIYSREWIEAEFKRRNLHIEEIYYAVVNSGGYLFVDKYEDKLSSPTDVE
ncbi:DUF421 domain-containing protein [Neobacillus drentensis]|uniref:DUF421 domain-containing protein n=1 Tax=Neobacillus drentensis TaxID=220684 RepID=UPI002857EE8C|nr:DUF421 domain-containing protein [Neobacillus drentensis]MDR7235451.1 uncharacterized membrane protein YcaP (DUF421 family) [Neobacillus drentensis]